jgi:hypothetical protein
MVEDDGGSQSSAGQDCPAPKGVSGAGEQAKRIGEHGERGTFDEVTADERAAIKKFLRQPGAVRPRDGRGVSAVRAALKFAGVVLLAAGVVGGYADGDEFDDVGCTVAAQTEVALHDGHPAQGEKDAKGKPPRSDGVPAGASPGGPRSGATTCGPDCRLRAEGWFCPKLERECAWLVGVRSSECRVQSPEVGLGRQAESGALRRIEGKLDKVVASCAGAGAAPVATVSEAEARRVFVLLKRLESGPKQRKAALATVFRLLVLEGHSQGKAARLCDCAPALISRRVRTIESRFGISIEQLRNYASDILEMEASVKGDRYRKRRGGEAEYEDGARPEGQGEGGYLPEEGDDCES